MRSEREERLAQNEAVFRDVNEELASVASAQAGSILFFCECANEFCAQDIRLTREDYERVRAVAERFAVAPGHVTVDVERVMEQHADYWVVEKFGQAAEVAEATDPR